MKVMVVDDEPVSRKLIQRAVGRLGYDAQVAEDGLRAWELYQQQAPDVIISDWQMPELDGLELCRRVRQNPGPSYTYYVLLTANTERQHFLTGMQAGADDYLTKPLDTAELQVRMASAARVTSLHRQLAAQKAELQVLNQRLFEEGRRDPLTKLGNRLRMREDLEALSARAIRYQHSYAIALCDVDFFKKYNDSCGHLAGDEVLQSVGRTLEAQCRAGDSAYRYGGEEFVVVIVAAEEARALAAAERWRRAVEALQLPHPGTTPPGVVTMSVGVAMMYTNPIEQVLEEADQALYQSKAAGRNRVTVFHPPP